MAHYDSRPRAEHATDPDARERPIDGANDGASGVAVLMELGRIMSLARPPRNVDLVFVDGEDWGKTGEHDYYLLGSREFARQGVRDKYEFGIVVDMIGDSSQQIYRDAYSEKYCKNINDAIWDIAKRLSVMTFQDSVRYAIIDDHHSLIAAGLPAIVIIDMNYPHWHTEFDTPDKCSSQSLANVGHVLVELIYQVDLWPKK
jgi:Zn-dependent M28 family amino/carboxypeptidase